MRYEDGNIILSHEELPCPEYYDLFEEDNEWLKYWFKGGSFFTLPVKIEEQE